MNQPLQIIFLGTNGWYPTPTGDTTCLLIETPNCYIILDAGSGIYKVDQFIRDPKKKVYLFLSHLHLDHIQGLHILNKFRFPQGYTIYCYKGAKKFLNSVVRQPFTVAFKDLPVKVEVKELKEGWQKGFEFRLQCLFLKHSAPCFGYRFEFNQTVITFCTDTGYCPNLITLAQKADVLITECAYLPGQHVASWPHLNPQEAGRVAKEAKVKKLLLMHFDAENYPTLSKRTMAQKSCAKIFPQVTIAHDAMIWKV